MSTLHRLGTTLVLCWGFFIIGLSLSVLGSTLPYLRHQTQSTLGEISNIYTVRTIGSVVGSFISGLRLANYNAYLFFAVNYLCLAAAICVIPWCFHIGLLMASMLLVGITSGFYTTKSTLLCIDIWGEKAGPFVQSLHFFLSIGAVVSPLLAGYFTGNIHPEMMSRANRHPVIHQVNNVTSQDTILVENPSLPDLSSWFNTSLEHSIFWVNDSMELDPSGLPDSPESVPPLVALYATIGGIVVAFSLVSFGCLCSKVESNLLRPKQNVNDRQLRFRMLILALAAVLSAVTVGTEICYSQLLTSFALKSQYTIRTGNIAATIFWASSASYRFLNIFITKFLRSEQTIIGNMLLSVSGSLFLSILGGHSEIVLYIGSSLVAAGTGPICAALLTWISSIMVMHRRIVALFTAANAIGIMGFLSTIGVLVDHHSMGLMYVILAAMTFCLVTFLLILYLSKITSQQRTTPSDIKLNDRGVYSLAETGEER